MPDGTDITNSQPPLANFGRHWTARQDRANDAAAAAEADRLNSRLNALTEQRLTAEYEAALAVYRQAPNVAAQAELLRTQATLDKFWADAAGESLALPELPEERETAIAEAVGVMGTDYSPEWQRQADINDGIQPDAEYRPQNSRRSQAASFADETNAWYQAVQPTGEIRRVRDQDLFDRNGYSQPPGTVVTQGAPVSSAFAAAFQPPPAPQPGLSPKM
jgi:hypothetical protein